LPKATDQLLKDHRLIRKVLSDFSLDNPRYPELLKTLQRTVISHAWFEDAVFFPAFEAEPLLDRRFQKELDQEHLDLAHFLKALRKMAPGDRALAESYVLQLRVLLDTHFAKEEDGLFPLAERILDSEGLNNLGAEMERRKMEVRDAIKDL
jgi:hemerythrin-like domain-containing protein